MVWEHWCTANPSMPAGRVSEFVPSPANAPTADREASHQCTPQWRPALKRDITERMWRPGAGRTDQNRNLYNSHATMGSIVHHLAVWSWISSARNSHINSVRKELA
eukprot:EG_transcript_50748